ncbi:unnamed protein product [Prunus armeniaca]
MFSFFNDSLPNLFPFFRGHLPNTQHPTALTRRQRAAPQDHFEDTTEVEDVAPTHDSNVDAKVKDVAATHNSNVEVHAEPIEPFRIDKIVVPTFVERWHPETNTFHMPFGEMTITLDDVSSILGIPVFGAMVALLEDDNDTNFELLVNYLGVNDEEATEQLHQYSNEYVSLSWLRARFSNVSEQIQRSTSCIRPEHICYISWVALCLLTRLAQESKLCQASRSKVKQITRYMTLLKAWVYEHMHGVVVPDHGLNYLEVQPRALHWIPRRDNGTTLVDV